MEVLCEMVNGHPRSAGGERFGRAEGQDIRLLADMDQKEQNALICWIASQLKPRKSPNYWHTSYGIKSYAERDLGFYISNNQFKDAMIFCGYKPAKVNKLNWVFGISEKSEAFRKKVW